MRRSPEPRLAAPLPRRRARVRSRAARTWRQTAAALAPGQLICHNDTGAYNWVIDGGRFVGMIDWDQAGPGCRSTTSRSCAGAACRCSGEVPAADAARRVALAAEAYGGVASRGLLDAVADRMRRASDRIAAGIERGDPGMLSLQSIRGARAHASAASASSSARHAGAARGAL